MHWLQRLPLRQAIVSTEVNQENTATMAYLAGGWFLNFVSVSGLSINAATSAGSVSSASYSSNFNFSQNRHQLGIHLAPVQAGKTGTIHCLRHVIANFRPAIKSDSGALKRPIRRDQVFDAGAVIAIFHAHYLAQ